MADDRRGPPALRPPGDTREVHASSVLVLAPHTDDEVLGCGGLLAALSDRGAVVRVLFLTDSGGGRSDEDRGTYRRQRRQEAQAAAKVLGLAGSDSLDLPDGELARHLEAAEKGIRRALLSQRPELLLVPSPLEVTADHRAAFYALHRVLAPVRDEDGPEGAAAALREATASLRVLVYEINQPAYPDLLVAVGGQIPRIEKAMTCYASQQRRHDYLAAALGLRRFRTLTLAAESGSGSGGDAETPAAEGYRELTVADFTTRSPAQLVRHLGGVPELLEVAEGPRISVVVRTRDRPELLAEALASLAEGTYRRVEVVLVNDGGAPPDVPAGYPFAVTPVELPENRGRAAAANAGVAAAGGDFVAFLDDDDVAAPEHLATLAGAVAGAGVRVAYTDAAVAVYELAGEGGGGNAVGEDAGAGGTAGWICRERRLPYSRDFDPERLLLDNYIPFNTLLIERRLFGQVEQRAAGPFDPELPFFEDWDFLIRLARLTPFHHLRRVTCEYRHFRGGGHHILGDRPRQRADFLEMKTRVLAKHAAALEPALLARAVDALKGELVDAREEARSATAALALVTGEQRALGAEHQRLSARFFALEKDYHALHGEAEGLRTDAVSKASELTRLYQEERGLRAVVEDQDRHLQRTYAEIERLQGVIREIESSRLWRLARRLGGNRRTGGDRPAGEDPAGS